MERKELTDNTSGPDQVAIAGETKRRVDETLEAMPKKQRTAFILRNHEGMPIADVARVMKTTEGHGSSLFASRSRGITSVSGRVCLGRITIMPAEALETMCKELEEDLVLYYYGEIADDEKRRIDQHLGDCAGCGRFLEDLTSIAAADGAARRASAVVLG